MLLQYFEDLERGILDKLRETPRSASPRKKFALEVARLGTRLYTPGNRIAWCGVSAPFDLLSALGVTSCFVEFVTAMLSSTGVAGPMLEQAEHAGYPSDACGYHRGVLGAALQGLLPEPDFLIGTTCPCTGGLATLEALAGKFEKDLFVLHIPQDRSDDSIRYLAGQMKDMAEFVTSRTGERLDPGRLALAVENSNRVRRLMEEMYGLAQRIPSPVNSRDLRNFGLVMSLLFGTEAAVEVAEAYRDEFAARVEAGESGVPGERIRLLWIQNRIQFKHPLERILEEEYRASVVVDELNSVTWDPIDPADPWSGFADRVISIPLNGPIASRTDHLSRLARTYSVDGAINPCHWGCRQGTGARGLIEESLKRIGVPVLNLEVDCVDPRNFAEGQLRTRLQAFIEMIC